MTNDTGNKNNNDEEVCDDEEDEDDEDWDVFDSLNNMSPLMKTDEIIYIKNVLEHIKQTNPNYYAQIMSLLDEEKKNQLNTMIVQTEARLNKNVK